MSSVLGKKEKNKSQYSMLCLILILLILAGVSFAIGLRYLPSDSDALEMLDDKNISSNHNELINNDDGINMACLDDDHPLLLEENTANSDELIIEEQEIGVSKAEGVFTELIKGYFEAGMELTVLGYQEIGDGGEGKLSVVNRKPDADVEVFFELRKGLYAVYRPEDNLFNVKCVMAALKEFGCEKVLSIAINSGADTIMWPDGEYDFASASYELTQAVEFCGSNEQKCIWKNINITSIFGFELNGLSLEGNVKINTVTPVAFSKSLMLRVGSQLHLSGSGKIYWDAWNVITPENVLSRYIELEYANDPIYLSMKLPSEASTMMKRTNPSIINYQPEKRDDALSIGAFYKADEIELSEDFRVYLGGIALFALNDADDAKWECINYIETVSPTYFFGGFCPIPWGSGGSERVPTEKIVNNDSFTCFNLEKEDLTSKVLHFWGKRTYANSKETVGLVVIYEAYTDEEGRGIVATVGADQYNGDNTCVQAFSGRNYLLTSTPRQIIGHNMSDEVYDWCVTNGKSPEMCMDIYMDLRYGKK